MKIINDKLLQYYESNLVCSRCKGTIKIIDELIICEKCGSTFSIAHNIPCFINDKLSNHQQAEIEHTMLGATTIRQQENYYNQGEKCYKWVLKHINDRTVNKDTKIICIGGSYLDDLPHINSNFKFNIDHLAHKYINIFPEFITANVKHIAAFSEELPFIDGYADIIYSRNSLDHLSNTIQALTEINRVLKPEGKFFVSVYSNSDFRSSEETTVIDDDFINNHLARLFEIEWLEIRSSESERIPQPPQFSLPNGKKLGWLYAICKKKQNYEPYNSEDLIKHGELVQSFMNAIYHDKRGEYLDASKYFLNVLSMSPFLESDKNRILYSKIRYLSINDQKEFKIFFSEFKQENRDPFWWESIIDSAYYFMKSSLKEEIKLLFSGNKRSFLERSLKNKRRSSYKEPFKKIKFLVKFVRLVRRILKGQF